ncbi:hypothetical protein LCGC14_2914380 [marine sediment metagenome]|uniref:Uncharacterized protein n=1 Tax=marine sediment metagenome TaxID=412755 RepID=A0A0F8ZYE4_9ZZZZ
MYEEPINVCCPGLEVVECTDTNEHQHLVCTIKTGYGLNPIISNQWCREHCLSDTEEFHTCPHYE